MFEERKYLTRLSMKSVQLSQEMKSYIDDDDVDDDGGGGGGGGDAAAAADDVKEQQKWKLNHEERLKLAMNAMMNRESGMVYTQAVKLFNVKRSTLHDHMSKKCVKFTKGRYPLLTAVEEKELLKMLMNVQSKGYVVTPYICRRAAFMYAKLCNYRLALMSDRLLAGRKWFAAFLKRNNVTVGEDTNAKVLQLSKTNRRLRTAGSRPVLKRKSKKR